MERQALPQVDAPRAGVTLSGMGATWKRYRGGVGIGLILLIALPFYLHSLGRGLSLGSAEEQAVSRFITADRAATWSVYAHMVVGGLLTALAPVQLSGALRRRFARLHHWNGRLVAALAVLTGLAGLFYIARQGTIGGPWMSAGFALYGVLLVVAALQTVRFARVRDPRHAVWAGRLVILALASFFYRVQYTLWVVVAGEVGMAPDFTGPFDRVMVFGFYLPWLAVHELARRWRGRRAVPGLA
ncbi:MAG: DUF2306 domain-containing protein [Pseudomonadota bacterium]